MSDTILIVFEGQNTERNYLEAISQHYFQSLRQTMIVCSLSVITSRDNVSDIYLLFDYDGHATMASNERLTQMLAHFDDELDNGKLYISYPMIESLKHLRDDTPFQDATVQSSSNYKRIVSDYCDPRYNQITQTNRFQLQDCNTVITEHCKKANYIVNGAFTFPETMIAQTEIFDSQKSKYIEVNGEVAVVCALPLLYRDFYGSERLLNILGTDEELPTDSQLHPVTT